MHRQSAVTTPGWSPSTRPLSGVCTAAPLHVSPRYVPRTPEGSGTGWSMSSPFHVRNTHQFTLPCGLTTGVVTSQKYAEHMELVPAQEQWKSVVGFEGVYEVSDHGRVRSLDRVVVTKTGVSKRRKGCVLSAGMDRRHRHVALCSGEGGKSYRVHKLVLEAFVGRCPGGLEARHLDDDPDNNCLRNLTYGTRSQNMLDRVRNGTHNFSRRTHCNSGHEYTESNTICLKSGRRCRQCKRDNGREYMRRKRAA